LYQKAVGRLQRLTNAQSYSPSKDVASSDPNEAVDEEKSSGDNESYDNDSDEESVRSAAEQNEAEDTTNDLGIDYRKNTPLLWAAYKGHFEIVWLLLVDGYSSNDLDDNGNNALHLAAVGGHTKIVKTLIDDGANVNLVNTYKNLPIDMANVKEIRELLATAMEKYASNTIDDMRAMNRQNIKQV
jgi:ankyrin repeat protein